MTVVRATTCVGMSQTGTPIFSLTTDSGEYLTADDLRIGRRLEAGVSCGVGCELELDATGRVRRILPTKDEINRLFAERVNDLMNE